jgi:hypothetical protein
VEAELNVRYTLVGVDPLSAKMYGIVAVELGYNELAYEVWINNFESSSGRFPPSVVALRLRRIVALKPDSDVE